LKFLSINLDQNILTASINWSRNLYKKVLGLFRHKINRCVL
jgi:hypothetical protein